MFSVGIGLTNETELFGIASSRYKVSSLASFDTLQEELRLLTKYICRKYIGFKSGKFGQKLNSDTHLQTM